MARFLLAALALTTLSAPALGACIGTDLMTTLPEAERLQVTTAIDAIPYARGNYWSATRGKSNVHIIGTYHFDDPRHDAIMAVIAPAIDQATTVLVEATEAEQSRLKAEMTRRPDRLFTVEGPTLPERLEAPDWQALSDAMKERGVPAFLASKMQPWYVAMLLGIPACAMEDLNAETLGLDDRVTRRAGERGIEIRALEPYDTVFTIFDSISTEDQLDLIRTTLALSDQAENHAATLTEAYFSEDVRVTWELGRLTGYGLPGSTPEEVDADMAAMEEALMSRRNRAWIPVIEAAADKGPVFAAFGALHLSGEDGVLALLERAGFRVERLPL